MPPSDRAHVDAFDRVIEMFAATVKALRPISTEARSGGSACTPARRTWLLGCLPRSPHSAIGHHASDLDLIRDAPEQGIAGGIRHLMWVDSHTQLNK